MMRRLILLTRAHGLPFTNTEPRFTFIFRGVLSSLGSRVGAAKFEYCLQNKCAWCVYRRCDITHSLLRLAIVVCLTVIKMWLE